jgi:hypothetical protein
VDKRRIKSLIAGKMTRKVPTGSHDRFGPEKSDKAGCDTLHCQLPGQIAAGVLIARMQQARAGGQAGKNKIAQSADVSVCGRYIGKSCLPGRIGRPRANAQYGRITAR